MSQDRRLDCVNTVLAIIQFRIASFPRRACIMSGRTKQFFNLDYRLLFMTPCSPGGSVFFRNVGSHLRGVMVP
jgi:hypothetical protein